MSGAALPRASVIPHWARQAGMTTLMNQLFSEMPGAMAFVVGDDDLCSRHAAEALRERESPSTMQA